LEKPLRVLVVDDMALYRKLLSDLVDEIPGAEVVGTAPNGEIALDKIERIRPDVITLDIEMPVLDGLETLKILKTWDSAPASIVVSSHTREGAKKTIEALDAGACEFITKPEGVNRDDSQRQLLERLGTIFAGLNARSKASAAAVPVDAAAGRARPGPAAAGSSRGQDASAWPIPEIVAIAVSTGGPRALADVIPRLPRDFPVPVVVVLHIPSEFTAALVNSLDTKSAVTVSIGEDGMALRPGTVYFAPGGKQMKVETLPCGADPVLRVTDDPPENHCRPSADYLMRSVADIYGRRSLGVIMTGMGEDGVQGLRSMKYEGATVIAQDKESCVVFGMPQGAVKAGIVDFVAPLESISDLIVERVTD